MTGTLQTWEATVTNIVDGDTFDVNWEGGYTLPIGLLDRIRIAGVDTNETSTNEPLAFEAQARLADLIPVGTRVTLQAIDENSNTLDRPVRHVFVDDVNVATILISEGLGLAASYDVEPSFREEYFAASEQAQLNGVGIWSSLESGHNTASGIKMFVNYDAAGDDANNLNDEYIHIENTGTDTIDLSGWSARSSARLDGATIEIPNGISIAAGESFRIHVGSGTNTANEIYLGLTEPVFDNTGDVVYLRDAGLNIQATQLWPDSIFNEVSDSIVIDDVQFNAPGDDALNPNGEWIILRNAGDETVDLSNWRIKDDGFDYVFTDGEVLSAGETLQIFIGSGTDEGNVRYWGNSEGILNNDGGNLEIWTPYSRNVDSFTWGDTPDIDENPRGAIQLSVNYDAQGNDMLNPNGEWVSLYNSGSSDISLEGFELLSGGQSYEFDANQVLSAGQNLRVLVGSGTDSANTLHWGNSTAILANGGDSVSLVDSSGDVLLHHEWTGTNVATYSHGLVIDTVNYDAIGNDANNPNGEWFIIRNSSSSEQNLVNWQINVGPEEFTFLGDRPIGAGETITVFIGNGQDTTDSVYLGFDRGILFNSGSRAIELLTPEREIAETHSWGSASSQAQSVAAAIDISFNFDAVGVDDNNPNGEWVNLRNISSQTISLDGLHLYTDGTTYVFDDDDILQAGERLRVHLGDGTDEGLIRFANGALDLFNNSGDEVELRSNDTGFAIDLFSSNDDRMRVAEAEFRITAVNPDASGSDALNPNGEWLEITNTGSTAADLQDWRIQYQTATFFDFDDSLVIEAGDTIRVFIGEGQNTASEVYWGNTSGILSNVAGSLQLQSAYRTVVDTFTYPNSFSGDDEIMGTNSNDVIDASSGNDRVFDRRGNDTVELGSGDDYVRVGGGVDSFDGGLGNDYISYYSSSNGVNLDFQTDTASGSWASNDTVINFESASGSRTGHDDLRGDSADTVFRGYGGSDRLSGRSGDDKLYGGNDNDILLGGSGSDELYGDNGSDFLDGGGGSGIDQLYGGADADIFHFDRGEGVDIINDFQNNIDTIEFDNFRGTTTVSAFINDFASTSGNDVIFNFGTDGNLTILNTTLGQLQNDIEIV